MPDPNPVGKQELQEKFSLDRERHRIRITKLGLAIFGSLSLLALILSLILNQ